MAPFDLGQLADLAPQSGVQLNVTFDAMAARDDWLNDKEVAEKAVQEAKEIPSVWFVDLPNETSPPPKELLAKYMQSVQDYRSWASLLWWGTVFSHNKVPQDGSHEAIAARSAFCAKVATRHMQMTPWLPMMSDRNVTKEIECEVPEFHTKLIQAVLEGFVNVTPGIILALEKILESLRLTLGQSASSEDRTIVFQRYVHTPENDRIRSYVRIISFAVNDSIKNVQNLKKTETHVRCTIQYNNYEAFFNDGIWDEKASWMKEEQKNALHDFRKQQTIDCPL
ncbi:hypothetical protein EDB80DRAFT_891026 [Ilyonectria destructans]|nr:hypothetical protein EDB80DRAFT_891026 [Ilyonectria destructans]